MKKVVIILVLFFGFRAVYSQSMIDSAITIPYIGISYGFHGPQGDLKDRFGTISTIGGQFGLKLKSNIYMAFKMDYAFGNKVKEEGMLDNIRTSEGGIIEVGGQLTDPILDMQGYTIALMGGYLMPFLKANPNSGFLVSIGPSFFQHKIEIDYRDAQISQLEGDYEKGYDRLTSGFGLNEFIGYIYFSRRKLINFYAGFEFMQTWSKSKRGFNYDTMESDDKTRKDNLAGFRFGWVLTLYRRAPEQYYYR